MGLGIWDDGTWNSKRKEEYILGEFRSVMERKKSKRKNAISQNFRNITNFYAKVSLFTNRVTFVSFGKKIKKSSDSKI